MIHLRLKKMMNRGVDGEEDQEWFHNVHGQNLRIAELVAKGLRPENPVHDSFETMKTGFAAEMSEREKRVVRLAELA